MGNAVANAATAEEVTLHELAYTGEDDLIKTRLSENHFEDVDALNIAGETALHVAARAGRLTTVSVLLDWGANVKIKTNMGITALHSASAGGYTPIVLTLLDRGAELDALDLELCTPLHHACHYERFESALALINAGADAARKNVYGKASLEFVKDLELREQLVEHTRAIDLASAAHLKNEPNVQATLLEADTSLQETSNGSNFITVIGASIIILLVAALLGTVIDRK